MEATDLHALIEGAPALFVTDAQELPFPLGPDHIIMNAARPLYGNEDAWGNFLAGRHYSRIDLKDQQAAWMIRENRALDGYVVMVLSRTALIDMALEDHPYRDVVLDEYPDEDAKWELLHGRILRFLRRPYGELVALRDAVALKSNERT